MLCWDFFGNRETRGEKRCHQSLNWQRRMGVSTWEVGLAIRNGEREGKVEWGPCQKICRGFKHTTKEGLGHHRATQSFRFFIWRGFLQLFLQFYKWTDRAWHCHWKFWIIWVKIKKYVHMHRVRKLEYFMVKKMIGLLWSVAGIGFVDIFNHFIPFCLIED